jgi:hypothetical protein
MTKFSDTRERFRKSAKRGFADDRGFEVELYSADTSFAEITDHVKVTRSLKRAVEKEFAPQSLIDSIKNGIRR